jgi:hypothetical protein
MRGELFLKTMRYNFVTAETKLPALSDLNVMPCGKSCRLTIQSKNCCTTVCASHEDVATSSGYIE